MTTAFTRTDPDQTTSPPQRVPMWLRRLKRVKAELRGTRFPHTTEEGLRQVAGLSAASLRMLGNDVRRAMTGTESRQVQMTTRLLLARLSHAQYHQTLFWKKERTRYFRP